MKRNGKLLLVTLSILIVFVCFSSFALAVTDEECSQKTGEEKVTCYADLVKETGERRETLAAEITQFNAQIALTAAQISQSEQKIKVLEEEITGLSAKIDRLDTSLDRLSAILVNRIAETYKTGSIDSLTLFFSSDSFSAFLSRYKYLKVVQLHDKKLLLAMEETKANYEAQKSLKEKKQEELEQLKKILESQKVKLNEQKKDREYLLEVTKGKEQEYQRLLAAAKAEAAAMEAAMAQALSLLKDGTPVSAGQEIALVGNTGYPCCSTGPHLHFETRKDGQPQNPASFLVNTSVEYDEGPVGRMSFSGDWPWPIENPRITQEYGMSYWAKLGWYNGGPHPGIDMTSNNHLIKAPKGGTLYRGLAHCGDCQGKCCASIRFVAIDHGDNLISWYWHVQ